MGGQLERNLKMQLVRNFLFSPPPARGGGIMVLLESPLPLACDELSRVDGGGLRRELSRTVRVGVVTCPPECHSGVPHQSMRKAA